MIPLYTLRVWSQRACGNKCLYSIYRILKTVFISLWFYYAPMIALLVNFLAPVLFAENKE